MTNNEFRISFVFVFRRKFIMIPLPNSLKVSSKEKNKAIFEIQPLYPGYGVTIGNSYRRVLLSSLQGAAITEVRIKDVEHEFSTLPGVLEDVIIILLNLKKVRFKTFSSDPQIVTLEAKGEQEVKAKDFKLNPQLEIVNPDAHIATLTNKKAEFRLEAKIERGIGYLPTEEQEERKLEIGTIPLDAIFTPVKKVAFRVENIRVGKRTDFDKLILELETDGTISPAEAFSQATEILLNHFSLFSKWSKKEEPKEERLKKEEEKKLRKKKVEELRISERTKNVLLKNNLKTVAGILRKSEKELLALGGMGERGVKEIKFALKKLGIELK